MLCRHSPTGLRPASDVPPTLLRPASDGPPTGLRRSSDQPPTVLRPASAGPRLGLGRASSGVSRYRRGFVWRRCLTPRYKITYYHLIFFFPTSIDFLSSYLSNNNSKKKNNKSILDFWRLAVGNWTRRDARQIPKQSNVNFTPGDSFQHKLWPTIKLEYGPELNPSTADNSNQHGYQLIAME